MAGENETNLYRDYIRTRIRLLLDQMGLVKVKQDKEQVRDNWEHKKKPMAILQAEGEVLQTREEKLLEDQDEAKAIEYETKKKLVSYGGHQSWFWVMEELSTIMEEEADADPPHSIVRGGLGRVYAADLLQFVWDEMSDESNEWRPRKLKPYYASKKTLNALKQGIQAMGERNVAPIPIDAVQGDPERRERLKQDAIDLVADAYAKTRAEIVREQWLLIELKNKAKEARAAKNRGALAKIAIGLPAHAKLLKQLLEMVAAEWVALQFASRSPLEEYEQAIERGITALEAIPDLARDERQLLAAYQHLLSDAPPPLSEHLPQLSRFDPIHGT